MDTTGKTVEKMTKLGRKNIFLNRKDINCKECGILVKKAPLSTKYCIGCRVKVFGKEKQEWERNHKKRLAARKFVKNETCPLCGFFSKITLIEKIEELFTKYEKEGAKVELQDVLWILANPPKPSLLQTSNNKQDE